MFYVSDFEGQEEAYTDIEVAFEQFRKWVDEGKENVILDSQKDYHCGQCGKVLEFKHKYSVTFDDMGLYACDTVCLNTIIHRLATNDAVDLNWVEF